MLTRSDTAAIASFVNPLLNKARRQDWTTLAHAAGVDTSAKEETIRRSVRKDKDLGGFKSMIKELLPDAVARARLD